MSKLSKFLGKPEEIEIKGEKLTLYPLKVKDLQLFAGKEDSSSEEKFKLSKEIIKKSLLDEEVTDEEIDAMDTDSFITLMDAINKINGLKDENVEKIRRAQERNIRARR